MEIEIKKLSNIDFKNMEKININEINDYNLKELLNRYSLLKNIYDEIGQKINFYEDKKKKFIELDNLILNSENEINNNINIIQLRIKEAAKLIQISDVFENYKSDLINNNMKKYAYTKNPDIFNEKNISEFKINNVFNFLQEYLKGNNFCISKGDITNYNLFIEIINSFDELKDEFTDDLDVKF